MATLATIKTKLWISYKTLAKVFTYSCLAIAAASCVYYIVATIHDFYAAKSSFKCRDAKYKEFDWGAFPEVGEKLSDAEMDKIEKAAAAHEESFVSECKVNYSSSDKTSLDHSTATWGRGSEKTPASVPAA